MNKIYYKKARSINKKLLTRLTGLVITCIGLSITLYIFAPLILWQIFLAPAFASQDMILPIPKTTLLSSATIQSLLASQSQMFTGIDYTNAKNWFPNYTYKTINSGIAEYALSIPKLNITNALVTTQDTDLSKHLVNLQGTSIPPEKGNTVIFGHSTLPQLYNPNDYKTIFAHVHQLQTGDEFLVNIANITYTYKIFSITVVNPDDTSPLEQTLDDSYLTIITCTPPGTIWKRLIVKARIEKL